MQILRTVIWVLLLVALLLFSIGNWDPTVTVRIWQGIVVDTKIPAIVIVSFLIGFLPMWLYYRGNKWHLNRKIASLENAARTAAATPVAVPQPEESVIPTEPPATPEYTDEEITLEPPTSDHSEEPAGNGDKPAT